MRLEQPNQNQEQTEAQAESPELTEKQRAELADEATQKAYLEAYREQMRRLNCPGCGETEIF